MFRIPNDKLEQVEKWMKEISSKYENIGSNGGLFTYSFTPTNLGIVIKIQENVNNQFLDITDYESW